MTHVLYYTMFSLTDGILGGYCNDTTTPCRSFDLYLECDNNICKEVVGTYDTVLN